MIPLLVVVVASAMQRKDKDLLNYWGKPQSKDELMYPITVWWWPAFCGLWNRMWAAWNTDEKGPTEDTPCVHQTLQYLCTSSYFIHLIHTRPRHRGLNRLLLHGSQKVYGLLKLLALSTSTDCLTRQGQDWTLRCPGNGCLSIFRMRRHSFAKFWSSVFRFFSSSLDLVPFVDGNRQQAFLGQSDGMGELWTMESYLACHLTGCGVVQFVGDGSRENVRFRFSSVWGFVTPLQFWIAMTENRGPKRIMCLYSLFHKTRNSSFQSSRKVAPWRAPWDHGLWSSLVINHPILYDRPGWLTLTTTKIGDSWDPMGHLMSLRFWLTAICWRVFSIMTLSYPPFFGQVSALKVMTSQEIPCRWASLISARAC